MPAEGTYTKRCIGRGSVLSFAAYQNDQWCAKRISLSLPRATNCGTTSGAWGGHSRNDSRSGYSRPSMETATADTSPSTTKGSKGYGGEDPGCRGGYAYGCAPPVKAIVVNEGE
eukprot:1178757-Prorocentrum_minimum.AAC.3